jgi:uncharacterized protein (DUF1330 family)
MKTFYTIGLSMLAGVGLGVVAVQTLQAQGTPPIYQITEIDVTNVDDYVKEFAPKAQAAIKAAGGRFLAAGMKVTSIEGDPPKPRVAVIAWDNMEKLQAYRNSAVFKEIRPIGDKYAKFRGFTVEGLPQ